MMDYLNYSRIEVYNFSEGDCFALSFSTWELAHAVNLNLGGLLFDGPVDSAFGRSCQANNLFVEVKVAF